MAQRLLFDSPGGFDILSHVFSHCNEIISTKICTNVTLTALDTNMWNHTRQNLFISFYATSHPPNQPTLSKLKVLNACEQCGEFQKQNMPVINIIKWTVSRQLHH